MKLSDPPDFFQIQTIMKAAHDHGWRKAPRMDGPWFCAASETARGEIAVAARADMKQAFVLRPPDLVAPTLEAEGWTRAEGLFLVEGADRLHDILSACYRLASGAPEAMYQAALAAAGAPPVGGTEVQRLTRQRVGQGLFRALLMAEAGGRCAITGVSEPELLRASHIVAWADCESDAERLDPQNGLLLSALWDAAFDAGLVDFDDEGRALALKPLGPEARLALGFEGARLKGLTPGRLAALAKRRKFLGIL